MVKSTILIAVLAILVGVVSAPARAQAFDVELSLNVPFNLEGFGFGSTVLEGNVSTTVSGVQAALSLSTNGLAFDGGELTLGAELQGAHVTSITDFTLAGFAQHVLVLSGSVAQVRWASTTVVSTEGFAAQTFKASVQQKRKTHTMSLSGTTKFGPKGFSSHTLDVGASMGKAQIKRSTTFDLSGVTSDTWVMGMTVKGVALSHVSVFGPAGLVQDRISLSTRLGQAQVNSTTVLTGEGFDSETVSVSGTIQNVGLNSATRFNAEGFSGETLRVQRTQGLVDSTTVFQLNGEGLQGGNVLLHLALSDLNGETKEK